MSLIITYPPGLSDVADSLLAAGQPVNGFVMSAIKENAAFGAVAWEPFYGEYQHGDTVPLPVSPVDGYEYERSELIYAWEDRTTPDVKTGLPSGPGGLLWSVTFVDSSGKVTIRRAYYVPGKNQTNTNDGSLAVTTFGIRGRTLKSLSAIPTYTDLAASVFAQDQPLSSTNLKNLSHNCKLSAVRSEVFIMNPSGAPAWAPNTAHLVGDLVQPTSAHSNGAWFVCALQGTTASTEPNPWPSDPYDPKPIQDGSVLWNIAGWGFQNGQQVPLPVSSVDGHAYTAAECVAVIPFWHTTQSLPHSVGINILWTSGHGDIVRLQKSTASVQPHPPSGSGPPGTGPGGAGGGPGAGGGGGGTGGSLGTIAGGSLPLRTYYFKLSFLNAIGESAGSSEFSGSIAANYLAAITSPTAAQGATAYNIYGSATSGAELLQNSTPIAIGTNWTEPTSGLVTNTVGVPGQSQPSAGGGMLPRAPDVHGVPAWAATTAYALGAKALDDQFNVHRVITAGTSGATGPSWNRAIGGTTTDSGVTWQNDGSTGGWMSVVNLNSTPNNEKNFPAQLSVGSPTTGCGIVNLAVTYENGTFPDGAAGVVVITQRALSAMASPGGANFVDFGDNEVMSGNPLGPDGGSGISMQDVNKNAKFSILRPEIFVSQHAAGDTVALPVSPVDAYAYSRAELSYGWFISDTGQPGGRVRDYQVIVDAQTGVIKSRVDYFVTGGGLPGSIVFGSSTWIGTAIRGTSTVSSGLPSANDGILRVTVITIARRAHETELLSSVAVGAPGPSIPPPSTANLIPNGGFEIWTTPNTSAVALAGVADDWGISLQIGRTALLQEQGLVGAFAQGIGAYAATQYQSQRAATFNQAGQAAIGSVAVPILSGYLLGLSFVAKSSPNSMAGGFFCRVHLRDISDSLDVYYELLGDQTPHETTTNLGAALSSSSVTRFHFTIAIPQNGDTGMITSSGTPAASTGTLTFTPYYLWLEFLNIAPVEGGGTGMEFVILDEVRLTYDKATPSAPSAASGEWNSQTSYTAGQIVHSGAAFYSAISPNTNSQPPNSNWQELKAGTLDSQPDGSAYKRVAAVSAANQATSASITAGAVSASAQQSTTSYVNITTSGQIATLTITPAGGYVKLTVCGAIASTNASAAGWGLTFYKGGVAMTPSFQYQVFDSAELGNTKYKAFSFAIIDTSPGTSSVTYSVSVSTNTGGTMTLIPVNFIAENFKV